MTGACWGESGPPVEGPTRERSDWGLVLLLSAAMILGLLSVYPPGFETNDDTEMNLLAAGLGLAAAPSAGLVHMHHWVGGLLAGLYAWAPNWPWYAALMYSLLWLSLAAAWWVIGQQSRRRATGWWFVWFFCAFFPGLVVQLQFTKVSLLAGMAGFTVLYYSLFQPLRMPGALAGGVALLLAAYAVRYEGLYLAGLVTLPYGVYCWRRGRNDGISRRRVALVAAAALVGWWSLAASEARLRDGVYRDLLRETGLLELALNYRIDLRPELRQAGFSENDCRIFCQDWLFSTGILSGEKGERLATRLAERRADLWRMRLAATGRELFARWRGGGVKPAETRAEPLRAEKQGASPEAVEGQGKSVELSAAARIPGAMGRKYYLALLAVVVAGSFLGVAGRVGRRRWWLAGSLFFTAALLYALHKLRPVNRISEPLLFYLVLSPFLYAEPVAEGEASRKPRRLATLAWLLLLTLLAEWIGQAQACTAQFCRRAEAGYRYCRILTAALEPAPDRYYFALQNEIMPLYRDALLPLKGAPDWRPLRLFGGGWLYHSPGQVGLRRAMGVKSEDLLLASIDRPDAYFVMAVGSAQPSRLQEYYREHYARVVTFREVRRLPAGLGLRPALYQAQSVRPAENERGGPAPTK